MSRHYPTDHLKKIQAKEKKHRDLHDSPQPPIHIKSAVKLLKGQRRRARGKKREHG